MDGDDKKRFEELMGQYLSDPFNSINIAISANTTMGVHVIGPENTAAILAGYLGSCLRALSDVTGKDEAWLLWEELRESLEASMEMEEESPRLKVIDTDDVN